MGGNLRDHDWKLLLRNTANSEPELHDLASDVGETRNIASDKPEVVAQLTSKLYAWESELTTPLWGPGSIGFVGAPKKVKRN